MGALLSLFASAAEDGETSSSAIFYIVGGAFAAWAVLVSLVAISRPDFPTRAAASRVVMLVSVLLVVGATSTAVITS